MKLSNSVYNSKNYLRINIIRKHTTNHKGKGKKGPWKLGEDVFCFNIASYTGVNLIIV